MQPNTRIERKERQAPSFTPSKRAVGQVLRDSRIKLSEMKNQGYGIDRIAYQRRVVKRLETLYQKVKSQEASGVTSRKPMTSSMPGKASAMACSVDTREAE